MAKKDGVSDVPRGWNKGAGMDGCCCQTEKGDVCDVKNGQATGGSVAGGGGGRGGCNEGADVNDGFWPTEYDGVCDVPTSCNNGTDTDDCFCPTRSDDLRAVPECRSRRSPDTYCS